MRGEDAYWVNRHLHEFMQLFLQGDRGVKAVGWTGTRGYLDSVDELISDLTMAYAGDREFDRDDGRRNGEELAFVDEALSKAEAAQFCMRRSYEKLDEEFADKLNNMVHGLYLAKQMLEEE